MRSPEATKIAVIMILAIIIAVLSARPQAAQAVDGYFRDLADYRSLIEIGLQRTVGEHRTDGKQPCSSGVKTLPSCYTIQAANNAKSRCCHC